MTSILLQPSTVECNSLRVRRRSSFRLLDSLPRLLSDERPADFEDCAIADDLPDEPGSHPLVPHTYVPPISTPSDAHLPGDSTCLSMPCFASPTSAANFTRPSLPAALSSQENSLMGDVVTTAYAEYNPMRRRLFSAFFAYFLCGWGDGITGAILPYFEADFKLNYMTSSLLFAAGSLGFAIGTLLIERVMKILGRFYLASTNRSIFPAFPLITRLFCRSSSFKTCGATGHSVSQARFLTLVLAGMLHAGYFMLMSIKCDYAIILLAYSVAALARAYLTSTLNAYVASTPKKCLGPLFGFWSIGAFASPFVCQTLIAKGIPWPHFYSGSLIISAMNICFLTYAFRPTLAEFKSDLQAALQLSSSLSRGDNFAAVFKSELPLAGGETPSSISLLDAPPPKDTLKRTFCMPYQWALSMYSWIQSGSETTTQGFMATYLLVTRHANPNTVGYVTSGFWAGQAISRFIWGYYTPSLNFTQRKYIIQACIGIMIVMQLLIWFVNSNVENAFSTAVVGFLSGPLFPGTLRMANDILPTDVQLVSMAIISAFASFGSAFFPFITGTISNIQGPHILTYVTVAQAAALFCLWGLFPSKAPLRTSGQ